MMSNETRTFKERLEANMIYMVAIIAIGAFTTGFGSALKYGVSYLDLGRENVELKANLDSCEIERQRYEPYFKAKVDTLNLRKGDVKSILSDNVLIHCVKLWASGQEGWLELSIAAEPQETLSIDRIGKQFRFEFDHEVYLINVLGFQEGAYDPYDPHRSMLDMLTISISRRIQSNRSGR
jgi:hypothetical protein